MEYLEGIIENYQKLKIEMLQVIQCLDQCHEKDREFYQERALIFSKELKNFRESIAKQHGIQMCKCMKCKKRD